MALHPQHSSCRIGVAGLDGSILKHDDNTGLGKTQHAFVVAPVV